MVSMERGYAEWITWRERKQGEAYLRQWKREGHCMAWQEGTPSICTHPTPHPPPHRDHYTGDQW
jgi:hypothetical protein